MGATSDTKRHRAWKALKWICYLAAGFTAALVLVLAFFHWEARALETKSITEAAPSKGRIVRASDVEVFLQQAGPDSGEPILLIHGTGAWSEIWRETMNALAGAGFHVLAMDVPPFGFSEKPSGALAYTRQGQAKRILGLLDTLGFERATLVGHSVGARPVLEAALEMPGRVSRLILVDPALGFPSSPGQEPQYVQNSPAWFIRWLFGAKPLRNLLMESYVTNPRFTARTFQSFVSQKQSVTDARVRMLQQPFVVRDASKGYGDWLEDLVVAEDTSLSADFRNLKKLSMPVAIIWGSDDSVTPVWQGRELQQLIPRSTLTIIDGVGHIPYIENPVEFNKTLLRLLAGN